MPMAPAVTAIRTSGSDSPAAMRQHWSQGVPQTGTPAFQGGDPLVPVMAQWSQLSNGIKEKRHSGKGTYAITRWCICVSRPTSGL